MKNEQGLKEELDKIEKNYIENRKSGRYNHGAIGENIGPWQIGQIQVLRYVLEMPEFKIPDDIVKEEEQRAVEFRKYMDEQFEKTHGYSVEEWGRRIESRDRSKDVVIKIDSNEK